MVESDCTVVEACKRVLSCAVMHKKSPSNDDTVVQVKSQLKAEFRRFFLQRPICAADCTDDKPCWSLAAFRQLVQKLHHLDGLPFSLSYTDPNDGDQLPLSNDENFRYALIKTRTVLRLSVELDMDDTLVASYLKCEPRISRRLLDFTGNRGYYNPTPAEQIPQMRKISIPRNFRHISGIISSDDLPQSQLRVRIRQCASDGRPLGFYIRDGIKNQSTSEGISNQQAVYISKISANGLAAASGLLAVGDEIIAVNGVLVDEGRKTLDQVTDMMVANSADLVLTIHPQAERQKVQSASLPSSPKSTKKSISRSKRLQAASSVFYVEPTDEYVTEDSYNEDKIIDYTCTGAVTSK